jgi:hypothetical protein
LVFILYLALSLRIAETIGANELCSASQLAREAVKLKKKKLPPKPLLPHWVKPLARVNLPGCSCSRGPSNT